MIKTVLLSALVLSFFAGCSTPETRIASYAHMGGIRHVYVEHRLADGRGIDRLIAKELCRLGYDASAGPLTLTPPGTDAIVAYDDSWTFDFTTYMIQLDIRVRDARSARPLAASSYSRPSIIGHSSEAMVHAALKMLFKPRVPPVPLTAPPAQD